MKIAVDAMGGDNAPLEIVKGAYSAALEFSNHEITLIGVENQIVDCFSKEIKTNIPENIKIVHSEVSISMEDDPMIVMKEKSDSSMAIGLNMLKNDEVDVFLSAGSTGALHVGSTLMVRKVKGIRRSAIAAVLPFKNPILMLDAGANPEITEDVLHQWAIIGSLYAEKVFGFEKPRVGLLNNGVEENKGTAILKEVYQVLKNDKRINFVGNIESRQLLESPCDVLVTDGFTGNVTLKLIEGLGMFMSTAVKDIFSTNLFTKLSYHFVKGKTENIKKMFDASEYGGAPLLGLSKPVIKAHGSSGAYDIKNAIKQAAKYYELDVIGKMSEMIL